MKKFLDFEKPVAELESKIEELRMMHTSKDLNIADEVVKLETKSNKLLRQIYADLTPWQKVQVARHPERPQFFDYLGILFRDFVPLAGDRNFADDNALIGGIARFENRSVVVMGHQKGKETEDRLKHNFGMPRPEGYRKAMRLMKLADQFDLPIVSFVDTAGAYPGLDAEERGQAEAIARCIETSLEIKVPFISCIIGEGGSGGAIAIATANTVLMLEHSIYSVISPEGCASILWRSASKAPEASNALRFTAQDLKTLGVIEGIIPEPVGGAHRNTEIVFSRVAEEISLNLQSLSKLDGIELLNHRRNKFLEIGNKGL